MPRLLWLPLIALATGMTGAAQSPLEIDDPYFPAEQAAEQRSIVWPRLLEVRGRAAVLSKEGEPVREVSVGSRYLGVELVAVVSDPEPMVVLERNFGRWGVFGYIGRKGPVARIRKAVGAIEKVPPPREPFPPATTTVCSAHRRTCWGARARRREGSLLRGCGGSASASGRLHLSGNNVLGEEDHRAHRRAAWLGSRKADRPSRTGVVRPLGTCPFGSGPQSTGGSAAGKEGLGRRISSGGGFRLLRSRGAVGIRGDSVRLGEPTGKCMFAYVRPMGQASTGGWRAEPSLPTARLFTPACWRCIVSGKGAWREALASRRPNPG